MFGLNLELTILLSICLVAACAFEFINGFHDTANAVATVIYTKSMKPTVAVIWSGIWNFIGVFLGGIAVAMGIVNLLPTAALIDQDVYHGISMILALILTAIFWNLGTWYMGLPCSSSHTLIGSIFGVGIAFMLIPGSEVIALNWSKVKDVGLSLLLSPVIGFGLTLGVIMLAKKYIKDETLFKHDPDRKHPPFWIRNVLILTCTSVSFSHGSNDGQKGVGLIMIILIALVPGKFAIDSSRHPENLYKKTDKISVTLASIDTSALTIEECVSYKLIAAKIDHIKLKTEGKKDFDELTADEHFQIRKDIILIGKEAGKIGKENIGQPTSFPKEELKIIKKDISSLKKYTEYSPWWVIVMISLSLGLGTMIGWKRIVVTVGERIGKTPLTYAQGASSELVTATTIQMASALGLPVSTTHVLSSGIAGSMVSQKGGLKNLRMKTVRSILIAWLITLPVTIVLSGAIFLLLRWVLV